MVLIFFSDLKVSSRKNDPHPLDDLQHNKTIVLSIVMSHNVHCKTLKLDNIGRILLYITFTLCAVGGGHELHTLNNKQSFMSIELIGKNKKNGGILVDAHGLLYTTKRRLYIITMGLTPMFALSYTPLCDMKNIYLIPPTNTPKRPLITLDFIF